MYDGNPGEIDFGSSYREVRVSEGSSYRESTVFNFIVKRKLYFIAGSRSPTVNNIPVLSFFNINFIAFHV